MRRVLTAALLGLMTLAFGFAAHAGDRHDYFLKHPDMLRAYGVQASAFGKPKLGVSIVQITPELREHFGAPKDTGVLVAKVFEDSAAEAAGIRVGDVITHVAGDEVQQHHHLVRTLAGKAGQEIEVEVIRKGRKNTLSAKLPEPETFDIRGLQVPDDVVKELEERIKELEQRLEELEDSMP